MVLDQLNRINRLLDSFNVRSCSLKCFIQYQFLGSYGNVVEEKTEKEELKSEKSALDLEANRIANEVS